MRKGVKKYLGLMGLVTAVLIGGAVSCGMHSRGQTPRTLAESSPSMVRVDPGGADVLMGAGHSSKPVSPHFGGSLFILGFLPPLHISPIALGAVPPRFWAGPVSENPKSRGFPGVSDTRIAVLQEIPLGLGGLCGGGKSGSGEMLKGRREMQFFQEA